MNTTYSRHDDKDISIEEKLRAMYELQSVVSEVDKIKTLRGELPLEVQDLEDDIAGLKTRLINLDDEIKNLDTAINNKKIAIKDSQGLIGNTPNNKTTFVTTVSSTHFPKRSSSRTLKLNYLKKGSKNSLLK